MANFNFIAGRSLGSPSLKSVCSKRRKALALIGLLAGFLCLPMDKAWSQSACGYLASLVGDVEVLRLVPGRSDGLRNGSYVREQNTPLQCGDIVLTGPTGRTVAYFPLAEARIVMAPNTRIEVAQIVPRTKVPSDAPSVIGVSYGKVRALIRALTGKSEAAKSVSAKGTGGPGSPFHIRTFSAVVGVRGTDFFVGYSPDSGATDQATIEGEVSVRQRGTSQEVPVTEGKRVTVATTDAAVEEARRERENSETGSGSTTDEPPRELPNKGTVVETLKVQPIDEEMRRTIRAVSAHVKQDEDFATPKAVQLIGQTELWSDRPLKKEAIPPELQAIRDEF